MSSPTLPEREQLRIIGDLAASNGLPSRSALEGLEPAQFDVGEPGLSLSSARWESIPVTKYCQ
jgi:hypothetical protein